MAKKSLSDNPRIPSRGPMGHGLPVSSTSRENPTVHSKADRRYGHNETHGQQPARPMPQTGRPSVGIFHETRHAKPVSEQVGHPTDGSGRFAREGTGPFIRPTHPNTGAETAGDHRAGASTAGAKGMADKT